MAQRGRPPKNPRRRKHARLDGLNLKMSTPQIPGWKLRWVNGEKNRPYNLNQFDDWEFVTADEIPDPNNPGKPLVGESVENPNVQGHSAIRMLVEVRNGLPRYDFLMKKRLEFVEEDRAEKHAQLDEQKKALERGITPVEHQRGTVQIN